MYIEEFFDTINACRFCFMCRHLATLGNVTFKEADTPRGIALICDKIRMNNELLSNPDYIQTMYQSPLSGACRFHCVSDYDEVGLTLAIRRDIVSAGLAPENVTSLAEELRKVEFKVEGNGDVLYYLDSYGQSIDNLTNIRKIIPACKVISGGDTGKALDVLGFSDDAQSVLKKFQAAVKASDCKKLVTSCTASYDMLKSNLPGVEVLHTSEYCLSLGLKGNSGSKSYYLDSDYLKNYNNATDAPLEVLALLGTEIAKFGITSEESYCVGEGAVVYDRLFPSLLEKLCQRIVELADDVQNDTLIAASPYVKYAFNKYTPQLNVITIDEAVAQEIS